MPVSSLKKTSWVSALCLSLAGCGGYSPFARHKDEYPASPTAPTPTSDPTSSPSAPPISTAPSPAGPICQAGQQAVGAHVTFLIDNSGSHNLTDCPNPRRLAALVTPEGESIERWQCEGQTSREAAVLSAFDALADVSAKDKGALAVSQMSIVQFPTPENYKTGSRVMNGAWISTGADSQAGKQAVAQAMTFTRTPLGSTPYGAAVDAANRIYSNVPADGKGRVAILVTDGEPTDKDPGAVSAAGKALLESGVDVITVFVTNGQARADRIAAHVNMITKWQTPPQPQFHAARYASFDQYLNELVGRNGHASLAQSISSQVAPQCVDQLNSICQRYVVEIGTAGDLANAFNQIIRSKVIKCL